MDFIDVLTDSDLCEAFTITRVVDGDFNRGRYKGATKEIPTVGVVSASTPEELAPIPEGDRTMGTKTFSTISELKTTSDRCAADVITWHGDSYKIVSTHDWSTHGYYKGVGVRLGGS